MWICQKCGRSFAKKNQGHYCGKAPANVDEYIELQDPLFQSYLKIIREIIRTNISGVTEKIVWSMPTYEKNGKVISFCALREKISLYVGEEVIAELKKELGDIPSKKSAIYFYYNKELPIELIAIVINKCFD